MNAAFIFRANQNRPYSEGRRIARERVISHSRSYKQIMIKNSLKQKRGGQNRESQLMLKKRKMLPQWWQKTACDRMNESQAKLHDSAPEAFAMDGLNKPYQIFLFNIEREQKANSKLRHKGRVTVVGRGRPN